MKYVNWWTVSLFLIIAFGRLNAPPGEYEMGLVGSVLVALLWTAIVVALYEAAKRAYGRVRPTPESDQ